MHRRRLVGTWLTAIAVALGSGCATTTADRADAQSSQPTEKVELDPMLVRGGESDDDRPEAIDVEDLFGKGFAAQKERRYEEAARHYEAVIRYFPKTRFYLPALYNAGLSYEKLGRSARAASLYRRIVDEYPQREDAKDAYFRLAVVYEDLGAHKKIVELMTEVLLRDDINYFDHVEAHVRRANALLGQEHYREAEQSFHAVLKRNQRASRDKRLALDSHYISQALFGLGRAIHGQINAIELELPLEQMSRDVDTKIELFTRAQASYIRAMLQHHPQWSAAAGYMIGKMYEDFYVDVFSAEIPEDMTDEELEIYFANLREQIRPLMERAIEVYEKNLHFARRIGADNRWRESTTEQLARIKKYLEDPDVQRRAERVILSGGRWMNIWDPRFVVSDTVAQAVERARSASAKGRASAK